MKKHTALVLAILLCAGCLGLAACGGGDNAGAGNAGAAASNEGATAPAESAAPADPSAKFIGSWKLAAVEANGVTMSGDFGEMAGMSDQGTLVINEGGTGSIDLGEGRSGDLTWMESGDEFITITIGETNTPIQYRDGALAMVMEQGGQEGEAIFTQDGKYAGAKEITLDGATPITSEAELLGTWNLVGVNMAGVSIYGSEEALAAAMAGGEASFITFKEGGVAEMSGQTGTWAVDANGATLTSESLGQSFTAPVMKLGDDIVIDSTGSMGDMVFISLMRKAQ